MANVTVDYFFSVASPFTYMGHDRFEAMAKKHLAVVHYKPADFGKIFAATGGLPIKQRSPQRQAYRMMELRRWRDFLRLPMNVEPKFFPVDSAPASHVVIAAIQAGQHPGKLIGGFCRAVWEQERNIADPAEIKAITRSTGLDADKLIAMAQADSCKGILDANSEEGIRRGVFGAPSFIIKDEVFWGQDRLDFVERALARA